MHACPSQQVMRGARPFSLAHVYIRLQALYCVSLTRDQLNSIYKSRLGKERQRLAQRHQNPEGFMVGHVLSTSSRMRWMRLYEHRGELVQTMTAWSALARYAQCFFCGKWSCRTRSACPPICLWLFVTPGLLGHPLPSSAPGPDWDFHAPLWCSIPAWHMQRDSHGGKVDTILPAN